MGRGKVKTGGEILFTLWYGPNFGPFLRLRYWAICSVC